ncbi:hypothetical protein Q3G72_017261 [Acer saccharum]|nr:hypothetical protein Q3G72_017261 [Acer saccharum]
MILPLVQFQIIFLVLWPVMALAQAPPGSPTNCTSTCGNVTIPFPFGIEEGCAMDSGLKVDCNHSKPYLRGKNLELLNISMDGTVRVNNPVYNMSNLTSSILSAILSPGTLMSVSFILSSLRNDFVGIGNCGNFSLLTGTDDSNIAVCSTCNQNNDFCQEQVKSPLRQFLPSMPFGVEQPYYSALVERQWLQDLKNPQDIKHLSHVPVVLDWSITTITTEHKLWKFVSNYWSMVVVQNDKEKKQDQAQRKALQTNGGLLLKQKLTTFDGSVDTSKLFNSKELDKATDHFNVDRILGQGGQATEEGRSLASYFINSMEENKVCDILDAQVKLGKEEEIMVMANLAIRCLNLQGKQRPTMKEVAMVLEGIRAPEKNSNVQPGDGNLEYWDRELSEAWDGSTSTELVALLLFILQFKMLKTQESGNPASHSAFPLDVGFANRNWRKQGGWTRSDWSGEVHNRNRNWCGEVRSEVGDGIELTVAGSNWVGEVWDRADGSGIELG